MLQRGGLRSQLEGLMMTPGETAERPVKVFGLGSSPDTLACVPPSILQ